MNKIFIIIFVFTLFIAESSAQPLSEETKKHLQARIDNDINTGIVVGIIDSSGTTYFSYGVKSLKTKEPVNEYSVFEIGSITKTFTAILLADMVKKGDVSLDDPLQNYLPKGVKAPTRNGAVIKLVHLANHMSSLPRMPDNFKPANPSNPYQDYGENQMYDFLNNYQLTRDIGSEYEYSNYAVGLLGYLLAARKGVAYEKLVVDVIAGPLNMNDTRITLTQKMKSNLALGHSAGVEVDNWDIATLAGAGAIRSTAVDMVSFLKANMGKTKTKLYPAMQLSHKTFATVNTDLTVGLCWHKVTTDNKEIIWHNGGTGGYRTFAGFTADGRKGVVVLSNSNVSVDDIGMHILNEQVPLAESLFRKKEPVREISVDEDVLDRYVGAYELTPNFIITITREGNQLNAQATGQPRFPVFAREKNVFFLKVVEAELTFNAGADGSIESVTLKQGGTELVGKRL